MNQSIGSERKLWERQDWETAAAYDKFLNYYLKLPLGERTITAAYNLWQKAKGKAGNVTLAPGSWHRLAQGRDREGKQIPNAIPWTVRAEAWDKFQQDQAVAEMVRVEAEIHEKWRDRGEESAEMAWQLAVELEKRARRMLMSTLFKKTVDTENGQITFEPTDWKEADIVKVVRAVVELQRLAVRDRTSGDQDTFHIRMLHWGLDPTVVRQRMLAAVRKVYEESLNEAKRR